MPTGIEWCDETFNPWWGCERVSPACAHCYADTLSARFADDRQLWGPGHTFRFFADKHWNEPRRWARLLPGKLGRRPRVFCASMADVFEERSELDAPRERLLELIHDTPELDWLILTKRPEAMLARYRAGDWPLTANLWLGTSIENSRYTWRADVLRQLPAAVRFISAEPLLGSLFRENRWKGYSRERWDAVNGDGDYDRLIAEAAERDGWHPSAPLDLTGIEWVIAGGESGPGARPTHPDWFREIRDRCALESDRRFRLARDGSVAIECDHGYDVCPLCDSGPAFLFKQWGAWVPDQTGTMIRVGKKNAGRMLDGRTWDEFPAPIFQEVTCTPPSR